MSEITISRNVTIPDRIRIARYRAVPDLGPRVLFFSGGSALKDLSKEIINYTHNSIHIITPFDSGGSSAEISRAFDILSVGDLRNRLMALADQSVRGNPEVYKLFAYRFPKEKTNEELLIELKKMAAGKNSLVSNISNPLRRIIKNHIHYFMDKMPKDFDLRGASIGNIILSGGYLNSRHHIDPVIYMFSKLVEVRGVVRPVTGDHFQIAARMEDGSTIVGQHLLTGKEVAPINKCINELFLTRDLDSIEKAELSARNKIISLIKSADLIVYPFGSFYSSLIANLLLSDIGQAISETPCPKIFIPNLKGDPEQFGLSLNRSVEILLSYLQKSCSEPVSIDRLLNFILLDTKKGSYPPTVDLRKIQMQMGIQVIDKDLITNNSKPYYDSNRLIEVLLSLT